MRTLLVVASLTLLATACGDRAQHSQGESVTFSTPSGDVKYRKRRDDSLAGTVSSITNEEHAALARDADRAQDFIHSSVGLELQTGDTLQDLDLAFSVWLHSEIRTKFTDSDVVRIVGSSIGRKAVDTLGVRWARITDEHGSEIGLVAEEPDVYSYPFSSVRYRIEDRKTNFISALFEVLKKTIEERSSVAAPNKSLERTREG
jgi:hypothetical protein